MNRYFFDIRDGDSVSVDDIGIDCASLEDVRFQAIDALPEIAREELPDGDYRVFEVQVRDATGKPIFTGRLTFELQWL